MQNAYDRYDRLGELLDGAGEMDLAFALEILGDTNNGQSGQIWQDSSVMYTKWGNVWMSSEASVYFYPQHPDSGDPLYTRLVPEPSGLVYLASMLAAALVAYACRRKGAA